MMQMFNHDETCRIRIPHLCVIFSCVIISIIAVSCSTKQYHLLSYDDYQQKAFSTPYFYILSYKDYHLAYFGSEHSFQPENSQFDQLKTAIISFQPQLIFIEGGVPTLSFNENEMIEQFGEPGLVSFLAHDNKMLVKNIEPHFSEELYRLVDHFDEEDVLLYYFLREVSLYQLKSPQPPFESYMVNFLEDLNYFLPMKAKDLNYIYQLYKKIFHHDFYIHEHIHQLWDPMKEKSVINIISQKNESFRNQRMLHNIVSAFDKYQRIFVVAGSSHAVIQEPGLRQFFSDLKK